MADPSLDGIVSLIMFWKRFSHVILVLTIATLAACFLYPLIQLAINHWTDWTYPPARVFRRVWMIAVILGLILARRFLGMRHPSKVGFSLNRSSLPNLGIGLLSVFLFLGFLSGLYLLLGAWQLADPIPIEKLRKRIVEGLIRGSLVSGIEEYVFRGLIFFSLCRSWSWKRSAVVTSLIFASLHFLEGKGHETLADPTSWNAGFHICWMLLSNMAGHFTLFPDAVGLFIVGLALSHAAYRSQSLWYGAGLHGGWIWIFTFRSVLFPTTGTIGELWIGGSRLFDGIIPILGILLIFPVTEWLARKGYFHSTPNGDRP